MLCKGKTTSTPQGNRMSTWTTIRPTPGRTHYMYITLVRTLSRFILLHLSKHTNITFFYFFHDYTIFLFSIF